MTGNQLDAQGKKCIQVQVRIIGQGMGAVSLWIPKMITNLCYYGLSSSWDFQTETRAWMWDLLMPIGLYLVSFSRWQLSTGVWLLDSCLFLTPIRHSADIIITSFSALEPWEMNNGQHGVRLNNVGALLMEVRETDCKRQTPGFVSPVSPFIWGLVLKSYWKECRAWFD